MAIKQREERRASFDQVAALYDAARPGYPEEVFHDLVQLTGLNAAARILEIGSGTGHATLPLARRGFRIDCIELGEQMAAVAHASLAAFPNVTITVADFDTWNGISHNVAPYDLIFSASAYHWLNPATRVQRIAERLKPHAHAATIRNYALPGYACSGEAGRSFDEAAHRIYDEVTPQLARKGTPRAEEVVDHDTEEWESSDLFQSGQTKSYRWQTELSAEQYVQMLNTHSDHRLLPPETRELLSARLRELIDSSFHGIAVMEYLTLLQIAEKKI